MSLQVWLPLNGNLNNQGLSEVTVTNNGATIDSNGKIGKCYSFNGNSYIQFPSITVTDNFSISIWGKWTAFNNWSRLIDFGSATSGAGYGFLISNNGTSSGMNFSYECGSGSINTAIGTITLNTWYNITVTFQGTTIKVYLNGNLINTIKSVALVGGHTFNYNYLGKSNWSSDALLSGSLNDFRLYDHCLSAKEVKEISKGLICHWKLSNPYETGQSNKYSGAVAEGNMAYKSSFTMTPLENERGYNYKLNYTGNGNNIWFNINAGSYPFTAGKRYYYSCKVRCHSANFSMVLRASRSENDWVTNSTNVVSSSLADGEWHEHVVSQVVNSTYDRSGSTVTCNPILEFYTDNLSGANKVYSADFDIKDVQVIESDCYVPFIDNSMITTEVKDCSGLGNNGTKVGNITYKNSSIRYDGCYTFTGDDYIKIPKPLTISNSSYFTIAMWVKPESGCGNYSTVLSNFSYPANGFWMAINTEDSGTWFYNGTYAKGNSLLTVGQWSHIAIVFNAGAITWYTNGVATSTSNVSSNTTQFTDYIAIGNSYTGTSWNTDFVGNISDVRIYSSVLSAEDIKELYNTSASIDKNGNMYAYEFKEE